MEAKRALDKTCDICGATDEDALRAVVACPHASALREAMRKERGLPPETMFVNEGPE